MDTTNPTKKSSPWVRVGAVATFLLVAAAALPATDATGATEHGTSFRYAAGGAADTGDCISTRTGTLCTMAGGAVCGAELPATESTWTASASTVGGVGGTCTGMEVDAGESFDLSVRDDSDGPVAFGVCVDADADGVCRPDVGGAADTWITRRCAEPGPLRVTPKASGALYVFVMDEVDPSGLRVCLPTTGTVTVHRPPQCADGKDNDGDGWADYPLDSDCDGPFDPTERPPQCSDGKDNDGNGQTDWPSDPGCSGPDDDQERIVVVN